MALWGKSSDLASLDSAGQADIAANSETQALRASVGNPDLRFIFTVAECPYRIVARRSAGIARLADLRGKRVGTQLHSSAAYFLDCMLRTVGLTEEDVVSVPFMAKTEAPLTLLPEALRERRDRRRRAVGAAAAAGEARDRRRRHRVPRSGGLYREIQSLHHAGQSRRSRDAAADRRFRAGADRGRAAPEATNRRPAGGWSRRPRSWTSRPSAARGRTSTTRARWRPICSTSSSGRTPWIAKVQGRAPRTRDALAKLIDDSVLREALAG